MKKWFLVVALAVSLSAFGCASTFLVSKNGKGYFFGSGTNAIYKMLCESGDLKKILTDTQLPGQMKDDLFRYNCSAEMSKEKVKQLFTAMVPEQRKDLRNAFKNNGYDINYLPC